MTDRIRTILPLISSLIFFVIPGEIAAHHAIQAKFDADRPVTVSGIVTGVSWENPHVHLFVNVVEGEAPPVNWAIELESPVELELSGWSPDTLSAGDAVTVEGIAAIDRSEQAWGFQVRRNRDNRIVFGLDDNLLRDRLSGQQQGAIPQWPDGQTSLGPPPGETGYWSAPSRSALVQDGITIAMDEHGLLRHIEDAPKVAPFQEWAKDLYIHRQRNYLKDDPMFLYCLPPGGPRHFQMPHPFGLQFVEDRARKRLFVLTKGGNSNWRIIYTGGRDNTDQLTVNPNDPLFFGSSVAAWEGNTLVIDSWNYNDAFWFSNGGLPHTHLLRLTERISRPELNTLHYEVTVNDPGAYTEPWTSSWDLQWIPGEEPPEYFCQGNRP